MKKALAVILTLVLAMSFAACGGGDDNADSGSNNSNNEGTKEQSAYELHEAAAQKMADADSMSMNMNTVIGMTIMEQQVDMTMDGTVKQVGTGDDAEMEMVMNTSTMGESTEVKMFYTDGYAYTEANGQKVKAATSVDDALEQYNAEPIEFDSDDITEESVEDVDGGKQVRFVLNGANLTDELGNAMGDTALGEDGSMTISDIEYVAVIDDDGNLTSIDMNFTMDMEMMGESVSADATMTFSDITFDDVTIELPSDLDSYTEVSPSELEDIEDADDFEDDAA